MYLSPRERRQRRIRMVGAFALFLAGFLLMGLFDHAIWLGTALAPRVVNATSNGEAVQITQTATEWLRAKDWYQLLRQAGFLPTWLLIAAALVSLDVSKRWQTPGQERPFLPMEWWRRGAAVALAPTIAGIIAEILRGVLHRQRPGLEGLHVWGWPWGSATSGPYGLPSSHAAVAFAGALMLGRFIPGARPVLVLWALGCGLSRLLAGAHFASDVFVGATVSYATVRALARTLRPGPFRGRFPGPLFSLA